jgi:hypothetical protein
VLAAPFNECTRNIWDIEGMCDEVLSDFNVRKGLGTLRWCAMNVMRYDVDDVGSKNVYF